MSIQQDIEKLEKIYSVKELEQQFSLQELKGMYKKVQGLDDANDQLFVRFLNSSEGFDKSRIERIERMWFMKNNIKKLHELIVKAISAIEQSHLLTHTDRVTNKLKKIVQIDEASLENKNLVDIDVSQEPLFKDNQAVALSAVPVVLATVIETENIFEYKESPKSDHVDIELDLSNSADPFIHPTLAQPVIESKTELSVEDEVSLDKEIGFDFNLSSNQFGSQFDAPTSSHPDVNSNNEFSLDMDSFNLQFGEETKENNLSPTSNELTLDDISALDMEVSKGVDFAEPSSDFKLDEVSFELPSQPDHSNELTLEVDFDLSPTVEVNHETKKNEDLSLELDFGDFDYKK